MSYELVRKRQNPLEKERAEDINRNVPEEAERPKNVQRMLDLICNQENANGNRSEMLIPTRQTGEV